MERCAKRVSLLGISNWLRWGMAKYRHVQRTLTPDAHHTFQRTRPLCCSIRNGPTNRWSRLTGYGELVLIGVPVLFENSLDVDDVAGLSGLHPNGMTGPHLDLRTHLRNRGNISGPVWPSACVYSRETKGVLALGQCPGPIGCLPYLYLFTFTKEL